MIMTSYPIPANWTHVKKGELEETDMVYEPKRREFIYNKGLVGTPVTQFYCVVRKN